MNEQKEFMAAAQAWSGKTSARREKGLKPNTSKPQKERIRLTADSQDPQPKKVVDEACTSCGGTGTWVGPMYERACFRCKGTGIINTAQRRCNDAYDSVRGSSSQKIGWEDHQRTGGNTGWGCVEAPEIK